jgi:hypothetical protein
MNERFSSGDRRLDAHVPADAQRLFRLTGVSASLTVE